MVAGDSQQKCFDMEPSLPTVKWLTDVARDGVPVLYDLIVR